MDGSASCLGVGVLRAYLDGELPPAEQAAVGAHLASCASCAAQAQALEEQAAAVHAALAAVPTPAPATALAWQRFSKRAEEATKASPLTRIRWRFDSMAQDLRIRHWRPALVAAALVVALVCVVTVAPLRSAAAQLLSVFRVQSVTVVEVNPAQMEQLSKYEGQVFSEPKIDKVTPVQVTSASQASQAAGFTVLTPGYLPNGMTSPSHFEVQGTRHASSTVNLAEARALLKMANLPTDAIPAGRDSVDVSATIRPTVNMEYVRGGSHLAIVQGQSPEVDMPAGLDLQRLGEVGLQFMGMPADKAQRLSRSIDWATTLVVPVPSDMASVQEVTVHGTTGYMVEEQRGQKGQAPSTVIFWQQPGTNLLYAVGGNVGQTTLLEVAESLK